ncbi:MAG TPA: hypothetical protein DCS29_02240 [Candidatus Magasanikbacteria bacterium]|nr:hypothetical protein [Candidatus Magasanikbacteria bacterium]
MPKKLGIMIAGLALFLLIGGGCSRTDAPTTNTSGATETPAVKDTSPIKLGWLGPLTGDVSSVGTANREGTELAVKEINDAGGINGRKVEVVYEDGACDSKTASNAGNKLINVEKVTAIVGGLCSGETLANTTVAEENKVVMVAYGSTAPSLTTAGDYIFRVVPSDSYQGKYAANFVYSTLGKKKVAVLYAKTDYTEGIAQVFIDEYKKLGGEVVLTDTFLQTDRDLKTQLTKVKNSEAEALYFPTYTEAAVVGFKQMKELGLSISIIGPEGYADPKIVAAEGTHDTMYTAPVSPENESFNNKFMAATKRTDVPIYTTHAYDATKILLETIKKVGTDKEMIKNELYNVKNYQGVSGEITFDKNGDLATANYEIMVIKNNKSEKYSAQ